LKLYILSKKIHKLNFSSPVSNNMFTSIDAEQTDEN